MLKKINVVLTGGHAGSTGYAVVEKIIRNKDWNIYWIGSKRAKEGSSSESFESTELPKLGVKFISIPSGRLQRKLSRYSFISLARIPLGFVFSLYWLLRTRPKVILSFGGYASLPVVMVSWVLRIPIVLHEQTSAVGLANRLMAPFANKIAIARQSSSQYLPAKKLVLTGNPTRSKILEIRAKTKILSEKPTLLVTGGSRGSYVVNEAVKDGIQEFLSNYHLIHQVGVDFLDEYEKLRNSLPDKLKKRYEVYGLMEPNKMAKIISKSDILISRAGANTVWEIMSIGIPSVLIPIPWTRYDEQTKNAEFAQKEGIVKILIEDNLSSASLLEAVQLIKSSYSKIIKKYKNRGLDEKASENVVSLLQQTRSRLHSPAETNAFASTGPTLLPTIHQTPKLLILA